MVKIHKPRTSSLCCESRGLGQLLCGQYTKHWHPLKTPANTVLDWTTKEGEGRERGRGHGNTGREVLRG